MDAGVPTTHPIAVDFGHPPELIERSAQAARAFLAGGASKRPAVRKRMHRTPGRGASTSPPIDVLAERLNTTLGALFKTVPDAWLRAARSTRRTRAGRRHTARRRDNRQHSRPPPPPDAAPRPSGTELTWEQCFEELDRYVELELAVANADEQVPGMRAQLESCSACHEDHMSLLAFVAQQRTAD
jgi:hypothetical protein